MELTRFLTDTTARCTVDLFATGALAVALTTSAPPAAGFIGTVGFVGDDARGALWWEISRETARGMSGFDEELLVRNWVGEMANQLLGRVKSQSLARGVAFRLGTPVVIAGTCLEIAGAVPNHIVLTFLGEHGPLRVSLELVAAPTLKLRDDPG